ncbi:hypothetical protein MG293_006080 [Ovis ammon polii]|uniref:WD repeat domain 86 n=1 Tax=Ovis ammon polii TaxID=230172 RepID=A0AAD4UDW9_OVIAM|nr:hypothetical protein MG293_006080 [Ovis ammon polii]
MGGGGSALRVCADHRGGINWLSLSPDGQRLLTGSEDGTARLWSTADGTCCALLQGHESYVTFCQLEDEAAFTCSADCTIRKWDVLTGQCLQVFRGHTSIVNRSVGPGALVNRHVYSGSADRTVKCWLADTGERVRTFTAHRHSVSALKYHAGTLFTGSGDARARAFDAQSGALRRVFRGHAFVINCIQSRERCSITACQVSHDQLEAQPGLTPISVCRWAALLVDSAHPHCPEPRTGFSVSLHTQAECENCQCGLAPLASATVSKQQPGKREATPGHAQGSTS